MAAVFVHQRPGVAQLDFQETRPSFQWAPEAWLPPPPAKLPVPRPEPDPAPDALRLYHDLTTAAWLDDDTNEPEAAFDAIDRQSWALARLVCGAALAVGALGLAGYLVG